MKNGKITAKPQEVKKVEAKKEVKAPVKVEKKVEVKKVSAPAKSIVKSIKKDVKKATGPTEKQRINILERKVASLEKARDKKSVQNKKK